LACLKMEPLPTTGREMKTLGSVAIPLLPLHLTPLLVPLVLLPLTCESMLSPCLSQTLSVPLQLSPVFICTVLLAFMQQC
jgi:hypothetical protein